MSREEPRFVVNYVTTAGAHIDQDEYEYIPPIIGAGVQLSDGLRYRIVDVWTIKPKRGPLDYGVHAIVQRASEADDRLGQMWPDYYGSND